MFISKVLLGRSGGPPGSYWDCWHPSQFFGRTQ